MILSRYFLPSLALPAALALAASAPAEARDVNVKIRVAGGGRVVQIGLHKDNKDNAVVAIYADGNDRYPVATLDPNGNQKAELSPGTTYRLNFSGFLAYCNPLMFVRTLSGNGVSFNATFGTLDKTVTFGNFKVATGTNPCTITSDGKPNSDGLSMLIAP